MTTVRRVAAETQEALVGEALTSAKLVHTSAGQVDGVEGLAEVVGEGSAAVMVCWSAWI
jgi:hypothetical protein